MQLKASQRAVAKKENVKFDLKKRSDAVVSNSKTPTFDRASSKSNSVLKRDMNSIDITK